jgi:hypothetical protein
MGLLRLTIHKTGQQFYHPLPDRTDSLSWKNNEPMW